MKKTLAGGIIALSFMALVVGNAAPASALTVDEIQTQIRELLAKVASLQLQLRTTIDGTRPVDPTVTPTPNKHRICSILARNLSQGTQGDDVRGLQEFLNAEGYLSVGATGYFGPMTAQAVARWQASEGVSAVGAFGPMSRERMRMWCGNPRPQACTMEYTPVCGAKPIVCITTPCNPIQQTYGNRCTMQADGAVYLHDGACRGDSGNRPPTISSFSGPTTLAVNVSGTWTIQASDPENGQLAYSITWGDERIFPMPMASMAARESFVQTTTFTHAYASSGTYTVTVVVRDSSGLEARTSSTVRVGSEPIYCTMEYAPVCGQPPEPACRYSIPACMMPTPGPQTYGNRCVLDAADATFLYSGECR